jgi:hypothetical protein
MVIFMLDDLKKKVVGFICLIDKISDELSLTNAKKGFQFKELKDKTAQNICDHWDEFFKVLQIEKDESTRDSQGSLNKLLLTLNVPMNRTQQKTTKGEN